MRTLTNAQMIALEISDPSNSFTINYARCQYGNRVGRAIATLISNGREVRVAQVVEPARPGFVIDGSYVPWSEVTN